MTGLLLLLNKVVSRLLPLRVHPAQVGEMLKTRIMMDGASTWNLTVPVVHVQDLSSERNANRRYVTYVLLILLARLMVRTECILVITVLLAAKKRKSGMNPGVSLSTTNHPE
jgi:hypothetical protein